MVSSFYGEDKIRIVKEGDTLDLGKGKVLSFHPVPNVHWPDTMYTFERSTKTLFSCDMFGAFGRMGDHCFDDELTPEEADFFETEGIRYYSNVMTTFTPGLRKAIEKARALEINIIAPGHGPVIWKNQSRRQKNQQAESVFSGNVYVLTGTDSFSAAMDFATLLSDNGLCKLIGEIPGNMPSSYGDTLRFQTPNAKLAFTVSYKYFIRPDTSKSNFPLIPDVQVPAHDAMEEALRLIHNN